MSTHGTQQVVLSHNDVSQRGSLRGNLYQILTKSNVDSQNAPESGVTDLNQMPPIGQQYYPSGPPRRNGRKDIEV